MAAEILFEEIQGIRGKGVKTFFKVLTGLFVIASTIVFLVQKSYNNQLLILLLLCGLICLGISLFPPFALITQIRSDGIYVRFPPMQMRFTKYSWEDIEEAYIRKYDAIREYAGFGIRIGPSGIGYIVGGENGLQLKLKNGSYILITTSKDEEVRKIVERLSI